MTDREKVIKGLETCGISGTREDCEGYGCPYFVYNDEVSDECQVHLFEDALALLTAQELRHRLEVHNIGNVDVPEGVTWEQFQAVMTGVVKALEHTDRGESWPYDEDRR